MEHDTFRDARRGLNPHPCPFEKAILAHCCTCALAVRLSISERETVACESAPARETCARLRAELRQNSLFALKVPPGTPLPHAKEMKAMCGGLSGLQQEVAPADEVADVHALVAAAVAKFGSLEALPYSRIMPAVAAFEVRRRRG